MSRSPAGIAGRPDAAGQSVERPRPRWLRGNLCTLMSSERRASNQLDSRRRRHASSRPRAPPAKTTSRRESELGRLAPAQQPSDQTAMIVMTMLASPQLHVSPELGVLRYHRSIQPASCQHESAPSGLPPVPPGVVDHDKGTGHACNPSSRKSRHSITSTASHYLLRAGHSILASSTKDHSYYPDDRSSHYNRVRSGSSPADAASHYQVRMARRPVTRSRTGRRCLLGGELSATLTVPPGWMRPSSGSSRPAPVWSPSSRPWPP